MNSDKNHGPIMAQTGQQGNAPQALDEIAKDEKLQDNRHEITKMLLPKASNNFTPSTMRDRGTGRQLFLERLHIEPQGLEDQPFAGPHSLGIVPACRTACQMRFNRHIARGGISAD